MSLSADEVKKIAHLARLTLSAEAIDEYARSLSNIIGLVEQMNAVDTQGVSPMAHPLDATARLREDRVSEIDQRESFQGIAPQVAAGLYLVPKVLE